ncbi:uncharacterized protein LOC116248823 [Nymphaea colorata]|nr:uncharacterized protein LOC116248823 [Nymphaea colorata]
MEKLPIEIYQKIFLLLDHQHLAIAQQVCRNWRSVASQNLLWHNLFKKRWGKSSAEFYGPVGTKSWKDVYEVQDRCDRVGLGLKIIREGSDYYIVHQGVIQRHLGSIIGKKEEKASRSMWPVAEEPAEGHEPKLGLLDKILFFVGDLEVAMCNTKRSRLL